MTRVFEFPYSARGFCVSKPLFGSREGIYSEKKT